MTRLTTHVLDTARGRPAAGVGLELRRDGEVLARTATNADGRTDAPLLEGDGLRAGRYALAVALGDYFGLPQPRFLDEVVLHFAITDPSVPLHVPLLATPWGYTTYRGS